jgi:hypothetical protein
VARHYSLSGVEAATRHVRFVLDDPLLRFWFRFVFPNQSLLSQVGTTKALREHLRPALPANFGECFERLCRESLGALYKAEGIAAGFRVGEHWDKSGQIDVVGMRDDGLVDLGECKWGQVRSLAAVAQELEAKVPRFPNPANSTIARRIFVRSKPRSCPAGVTVHDVASLASLASR